MQDFSSSQALPASRRKGCSFVSMQLFRIKSNISPHFIDSSSNFLYLTKPEKI
jgi:hypothetical protein